MRRLSFPRRGWLPAAVGVLLVLVALLLWLRDSSLVGVERVAVTGASGPDAPKIEAALRAAARDMTTLHVRKDDLEQAVEEFPTVGRLEVDRDFPDGLRIEVVERSPVAVVREGSERVPVTAGGSELRGATAPDDLPVIEEDEHTDRVLALLAAAPVPLLRRAERAGMGPKGLTVRMADGPVVYFGGADDLEAKWAAAARVLADPTAEGASYVDVRVPERTAAGGIAPIQTEEEEAIPQTPADPGATTPAAAPAAAPGTDPGTGAPAAADPAVPAPTGGAGTAVPTTP